MRDILLTWDIAGSLLLGVLAGSLKFYPPFWKAQGIWRSVNRKTIAFGGTTRSPAFTMHKFTSENLRVNIWRDNLTSDYLKCHCDEISLFFFPLFLPRITYCHERCPFVQKEKIKKVSFIKISPLEKWNLPSAIARNWFQLSPLFSQRQLYLWRHLPNTRLMIAWF